MKKWLIPVGIIVVLIAIVAFWSIGIKNTALQHSQAVNKDWGNVQRLTKEEMILLET
jgi:LemA protein